MPHRCTHARAAKVVSPPEAGTGPGIDKGAARVVKHVTAFMPPEAEEERFLEHGLVSGRCGAKSRSMNMFSWRISRSLRSATEILAMASSAGWPPPSTRSQEFARFAPPPEFSTSANVPKLLLQPIEILQSDDEVAIGVTWPRRHVFGDRRAVLFSKRANRVPQRRRRGDKKRTNFVDKRLELERSILTTAVTTTSPLPVRFFAAKCLQ